MSLTPQTHASACPFSTRPPGDGVSTGLHPGWARSLSGPVTLLSSLSAPCPPTPPSLASPAAHRPLGMSLSQAPTGPWLLTPPLLGPPTSLLSCAPSSVLHCPQTLLPPSPTFQPWPVDGRLLRPEGLSPPAQQQCKGRGPVAVPATSGSDPRAAPQPAHRPRALTQGSLGRSQLPLTSAHVFLHHLGLRPSPSRGHVPTSQMGPPRQDGGHG